MNEPTNGSSSDPIAQLVRLAGRGETVPEDRTARVHAAALAAFRRQARTRSRNRVFTVLALAACAVLAVSALVRTRLAPVETEEAAETLPRTLTTEVVAIVEVVVGDVRGPGDRQLSTADGTLRHGMSVVTGANGGAALRLTGGGSLRIAADTSVRLTGGSSATILRGTIYADTATGSLSVDTPWGRVTDIGTQFEVRASESDLRVRVREGIVELRAAPGQPTERVGSGTELVAAGGARKQRPFRSDDPEWSWVSRLAPPFELEGKSLLSFLKWAAREKGLTLRFDTPALEKKASTTILHGSIGGMSVEDALLAVVPTTGLDATIESGRLQVRASGAKARA